MAVELHTKTIAKLLQKTGRTFTSLFGASAATYYGSDGFTDASATTLALHTPSAVAPAGAATSWTEVNGASPTVQILNNRLVNATAVAGVHRMAMNSAVTPTDHEVTFDLTFFTNLLDSSLTAAVARMTGGGAGVGGYHLVHFQSATPGFRLLRITDAFATTQLGADQSYAFPASGTVVPCRIRCVGGNVKCYVGGALILDQTDGTPLTGTKAGVYFNSGGTAPAAATGVHLDNLVIRSPA
jgi:hypothetical protein